MITIGSLFCGIGGFELGLERAIPNSKVIWQCEQDRFCRSILQKHWPGVKIYEDIRKMSTKEVQRPDILCGGFPCQDISVAGKGGGIHGKKSGLWWHMAALIGRIRPDIIVLENVPAITFRGGREVLGNLAEFGYDAEWTVISAKQFGAPHLRRRWFLVAYPNSKRSKQHSSITKPMEQKGQLKRRSCEVIRREQRHYWKRFTSPSPLCRVDDGISKRVDRIRALGNAIVPQCSEYIGRCIVQSGLLEELTR